MSELARIAQDLQAHVHEVPPHISKVMREAAAALYEQSRWVQADCVVQSAPIPPPELGGKHRRPAEAAPCS